MRCRVSVYPDTCAKTPSTTTSPPPPPRSPNPAVASSMRSESFPRSRFVTVRLPGSRVVRFVNLPCSFFYQRDKRRSIRVSRCLSPANDRDGTRPHRLVLILGQKLTHTHIHTRVVSEHPCAKKLSLCQARKIVSVLSNRADSYFTNFLTHPMLRNNTSLKFTFLRSIPDNEPDRRRVSRSTRAASPALTHSRQTTGETIRGRNAVMEVTESNYLRRCSVYILKDIS